MNSSQPTNEFTQSHPGILTRLTKPQELIWRVRILLAVILTLTILPYFVGRTILVTLMTGTPEQFFLVVSVVVMVMINLLCYHQYLKFYSSRERLLLLLVLVVGWAAISGYLVYAMFSSQVPRYKVAMLFIPMTFVAVWLSWMFFVPMKAGYRLLITFLFILPVEGFISSLEVTGLSGNARVDFRWRQNKGSKKKQELPLVTKEGSSKDLTFPEIGPSDFPRFLGLNGNGVIQSDLLQRDWKKEKPKELWRQLVGKGWSAFSVVGDYAITQELRNTTECVVCYDAKTVDLLWIHEDDVKVEYNMGGDGPRATPTIHEGRVYTIGTTGIFNCLDALTGMLIWSKNILEENGGSIPEYQFSSSPLIVGDLVIVAPTGTASNALVAYDRISGDPVWSNGVSPSEYGSPQLFTVHGKEQVVIYTSADVVSHDPLTGEILWSFHWDNGPRPNCSQPVQIPGTPDEFIISTGYGKGVARFRVNQSEEGKYSTEELWTSRDMKCKFTTPVIVGEYLYGLDDGIFACVRLSDGKKMWKKGRYGHGQILLVGNQILVQTEKGGLVIVNPAPGNLKEITKIKALTGKTWNNPALAGNLLLVRNDHEAICFDLSKPNTSKQESKEVTLVEKAE